MHPILLKFGPITIYSYGAMFALGFALSIFLIYKQAERFGIGKDKVVDMGIIILIAGIVGARALYILLNAKYYLARPLEMIDLPKGGIVWYGGFLGASIALIWYTRRNDLDFWSVADLIAPYLALAHAIGRIGCFLNGCCYGAASPAGCPFAVIFPGDSIARYPTQLYSALLLLLIFAILRIWQTRPHFTSAIFLGYCMLYSCKRFLMEFLRGDNEKIFLGLTISQYISAAVLLAAACIFMLKAAEWKKKKSGLK